MAIGQVLLNDVGYEVVPLDRDGTLLRRYQVEPFVLRTVGEAQLRQETLRTYTAKLFSTAHRGFAGDRLPTDQSEQIRAYSRFYDSTADTRWRNFIVSGILVEQSTETGLEVVRSSALFKNNFWATWQDGTSTDLLAKKYVTTTWTTGGTIHAPTSNAISGLDLKAFETHLVSLHAHENDHLVYRSTDGATWDPASTPITAGLLDSGGVAVNEDINAGLLEEIGGELVAVIWHEANGTITFFTSATGDAGNTWADEAVDIQSQDGPLGVAAMRSPDGYQKLYVLTREGLWEVDTLPITWTLEKIYPTDDAGDYANSRRLAIAHGRLWIGLGGTDDEPMRMTTAHVENGQWIFTENRGLDGAFDIKAELLGPSRYMTVAGGQLFVSMGGGKASRNARVLSCTGIDEDGFAMWHSMHRHGTDNQEIQWIGVSSRDNDIQYLHLAVRTATGTSDSKFLAYPLTHPNSIPSATIKRINGSTLDLRRIDGGLPTVQGNFLQLRAHAGGDLATSGETITAKYGVNGSARSTNTLGSLTSGANKLDVGSSLGANFRDVGIELTFNRGGTETKTVELYSVELDFYHFPETLDGFEFHVDLAASATKKAIKKAGGPIATLDAARGNIRNLKFGNFERFVRVVEITYFEKVASGPGARVVAVPDANALRTGFARVKCEEVIT